MPRTLQPVLSDADLPVAELWAARIDGELFRLGDCFTPIDEVEQPSHRARAVFSATSDFAAHRGRLIAEQLSAAWIWGATGAPPVRHQFCVAMASRTGRDLPRSISLREVVIEDCDIVILGGCRVTTALRTIIDLARFSETFEGQDARAVSSLMHLSGITLESSVEQMNSRRNLPGKHRAIQRLSRC
ncbi:hypothetical protein QMG83_08235 [Salinibacterium sp. G-O1]|uniref:hypothetical protein n=1 Tax=Salinibacterium sp. G-O1 TaxID=3046208 RepID=UPI0024B9B8AD|nr:hypothetical protein [Salinibacterium sp. G-O1]MDJ0335212.1 hypothetical protein [Salinibacterium sp. G-O1]